MRCEDGSSVESSSMNSDSSWSFANASSDSDFSFANSRTSDVDINRMGSRSSLATTISSVECSYPEEEEKEGSQAWENIVIHTPRVVRHDYIDILPNENTNVENSNIASNTTRFKDSAKGIYNDFDNEDQYLDPTFK
jgi:hypothetical protein